MSLRSPAVQPFTLRYRERDGKPSSKRETRRRRAFARLFVEETQVESLLGEVLSVDGD